MKDIIERIDELISPAILSALKAKPKAKATSGVHKEELNKWFNMIMKHKSFSTKPKQALKDIIKKQGLNKNWTKLLKGHYKEMMRYV